MLGQKLMDMKGQRPSRSHLPLFPSQMTELSQVGLCSFQPSARVEWVREGLVGEGGVLGLRVPIFSSMMGVVAAESLLQLKRCGEWHDMGIFGTFYYFPQHRNDGPMVTSRWYYFNLYWDTKGQISQYLISRKESK